MVFFDAPPKRKRIAYGLTLMVIVLILLVEQLPQPWRGIVDAGSCWVWGGAYVLFGRQYTGLFGIESAGRSRVELSTFLSCG